jgi:hypothetical protein
MLVKVEDFTANFKRVVRHNPFRMPGKEDPGRPKTSSDDVLRARNFAIERHAGQMYGDQPYVYHLDLVKGVLERFGYTDPELLQAAYLHDVIEDTPTTREEVEQAFGPRVAALAWAVTDEPGANRKERKINTYPKIKATPGATAIKLADRIANTENPNGMKNDMYRKEQPAFREALYTGEYQDMWDHLDTVLGNSPREAGIAPGKPEDFDYGRPDDWLLGFPPEGEVWIWNPVTEQYELQIAKKATSRLMYHVAPASARQSIQTEGLSPDKESSPWSGIVDDRDRGVYMWTNSEDAENYVHSVPGEVGTDYDIWEVNTDGLDLYVDEEFPDATYDDSPSLFSFDPIEPTRLRLVDTVVKESWGDRYGSWRDSSSNYRKEVQELLKECQRQGLQVKKTKKNHYMVTQPGNTKSVLIASSPSIASSIKDSIGHLRRNFGFQWRRSNVKQSHWMRGFKAILLHPKEGIAIGQTEFDEHQGIANREFLDKDGYRNSYRGLYNPQTQQLVHMTNPGYRETVTKDEESAKRARPIWEKAMREWKLPVKEYGMMMLSRDPGGHRFVALPEDKEPYKPVTWNPMQMRVPEGPGQWMTANVHDDLHDKLLDIFHRTLPQEEPVKKVANLSEYKIEVDPHTTFGATDVWFKDPKTDEPLGNVQYHPNMGLGGTYIDYLGYVTDEGDDTLPTDYEDIYGTAPGEARNDEMRERYPNLARDMLRWVSENLEPPFSADVQNKRLLEFLNKRTPKNIWPQWQRDLQSKIAYKLPGNWLAVLYEEDNGILEVALDPNETHDDVARKISERMILDGEDRDYADPQAVYNRSWRGLYNPDLSAFAHDAVPGGLGDDDWTDNFYRDEWLNFIGDRLPVEKFGKFIQEMVPGRGERRRVKWYESPEEKQQRSIERELAEQKFEEERRRRQEQLGIVDGI